MTDSKIIQQAIYKFEANKPIIAKNFYFEKFAKTISELSFYKTLERMYKSGKLGKVAKGIYYLPKKSKYGAVPLSDKDIVSAFVENNTGTVIGYALYNSLNISTQIPKTINVLSSAIDGFTKTIGNIRIEQMSINYTEPNKNIVHGLDVLQNYYIIQDLNYAGFISFTEDFAETFDEAAFEQVISHKKYAKSTIAFAREVLNFYGVKNNLHRRLSTMSNYKHPKMEEIYAASQLQ